VARIPPAVKHKRPPDHLARLEAVLMAGARAMKDNRLPLEMIRKGLIADLRRLGPLE
jgi:hypothetical protein